jgi:hypothetical protein
VGVRSLAADPVERGAVILFKRNSGGWCGYILVSLMIFGFLTVLISSAYVVVIAVYFVYNSSFFNLRFWITAFLTIRSSVFFYSSIKRAFSARIASIFGVSGVDHFFKNFLSCFSVWTHFWL